MRMGFVMFFALLGACNAYIARRLWQCMEAVWPGLSPWWGVGLFALLFGLLMLGFTRSFLPVPAGVKEALKVLGSVWMGVFVYLFLFLLLSDILLALGGLFRLTAFPAPKGLRAAAVTAALVLTALVSLYGVVHARGEKTVRYDVTADTPMDGEVRIVLLTDVHLGAVGSERRLPRIVERIKALEPDLICIAGDFFDNDFAAIRRPEEAAALLRELRPPLGIYMCPGNHDAGSTWGEMRAFLADCGITLLAEESVTLEDRLVLVGRQDPSPIGGMTGFRRGDTKALMSGLDTDLPVVVLDHNPAGIGGYEKGDLILCGHTHKGQIFPGSLFTRRIYTVDHGWYRRDGSSPQVIVSAGAGTWGMPMRVGSDNEIVVVTLRGLEE